MSEIYDPGNTKRVEELYVFLSVDDLGRNGICAGLIPGVGASPMVTSDLTVAEAMKPTVAKIAREAGKKIILYAFRRGLPMWESDDDEGMRHDPL